MSYHEGNSLAIQDNHKVILGEERRREMEIVRQRERDKIRNQAKRKK